MSPKLLPSSTELFSVPTLSMSPAEVFQKELMTLTCRSEQVASERLGREELSYSLVPPEHLLYPRVQGVFTGKALGHSFNYTCAARARGIVKYSQTLTVRPKGKEPRLAHLRQHLDTDRPPPLRWDPLVQGRLEVSVGTATNLDTLRGFSQC